MIVPITFTIIAVILFLHGSFSWDVESVFASIITGLIAVGSWITVWMMK